MHFRCLYILPLTLVVLLICGCAGDERKGERIYVPGAGGLPGYTVYVRDADPPQVSRVYELKNNKETKQYPLQKSDEKDKIDKMNKRIDSLSSLYYYRSPNPNRLTRIRLRRF